MQLLGPGAPGRLAGFQEVLQQGLFGEIIDQMGGCHLLLALDQAQAVPLQRDRLESACAPVPEVRRVARYGLGWG